MQSVDRCPPEERELGAPKSEPRKLKRIPENVQTNETRFEFAIAFQWRSLHQEQPRQSFELVYAESVHCLKQYRAGPKVFLARRQQHIACEKPGLLAHPSTAFIVELTVDGCAAVEPKLEAFLSLADAQSKRSEDGPSVRAKHHRWRRHGSSVRAPVTRIQKAGLLEHAKHVHERQRRHAKLLQVSPS